MSKNDEQKKKELEKNLSPEEIDVREDSEVMDNKIIELQEEKEQLYNRLQRAVADMQNYQKRSARERQEAIQRTEVNVLERFLFPLIDDLDRAMKAAAEHGYKSDDPLYHGVSLVLQQAFNMLKQADIEPIEAEGETFDPLYHEAIMELPTDCVPENTIIQVLSRGYTQEAKTIRPARVVIAKSLPAQEQPSEKDQNDKE